MTVSSYDPAGYDLSFAGNIIEGFADGSAISVAREANVATDKAGIMGDVVVSWQHDKRATVTIVLMPTAASNDVLSAAADNRIVGSFLLRDRNGTTRVQSDHAWVQKIPDLNVEAEAPPRTWEIRLAQAKTRVGSTPALAVG